MGKKSISRMLLEEELDGKKHRVSPLLEVENPFFKFHCERPRSVAPP